MNQIILASSSPRRQELLRRTGLPFDIEISGYEEDNTLDLPPHELVKHLAAGKANWVAQRHPDAIVIGADTLVVFEGSIFGKPSGPDEVREMISALSGQWHTVVTGLAIAHSGQQIVDVSTTRVHMRRLSAADINRYSKLQDPLDKAGAYGVQTTASIVVDRVEGDYHGLVGLPMSLLALQLQELGINLLSYMPK